MELIFFLITLLRRISPRGEDLRIRDSCLVLLFTRVIASNNNCTRPSFFFFTLLQSNTP